MSKIVEKFHQICQEKSNDVAFYYLAKKRVVSKTYAQVEQDVMQVSKHLRSIGVKPGDRLLAFAKADYDLVVYILAAFQLGAAVMYIDIFAKQDTLRHLFAEFAPQFVLASRRTRLVKFMFREINKIQKVIIVDERENYQSNVESGEISDLPETQPALLTTTTGSTGFPKIVVRTHGDLLAQLDLIMRNIAPCQTENIVLTTSYIYVFANLLQGFTTVLPNLNLRRKSSQLNRKLQKFQNLPINMIITSPDFCLKTQNYYSHLQRLYFGGAILNLTEARQTMQKFIDAEIIYIYGCTECNLISKNLLRKYIADLENQGISNLGKIVKGVKVQIGPNHEICVQSAARTDNYLGQNNRRVREFYDTSDRGYLQDDDLIYLGKSHAVLNTPQGIIYSAEIEQAVVRKYHFPKCAALEHQQKYYLFIESRMKSDPVEIVRFVRKKFGIDMEIKTIRKIPCDIKHHTKINYQKLQQELK